jgi:Flp pilus assembly protein TadG
MNCNCEYAAFRNFFTRRQACRSYHRVMGTFRHMTRNSIADESAASAVEFALVFPVFLMVLFGIVSFGSYLAVVHGVQQLAAEAARASIAGLSDSERKTLAQGNIDANIKSYPLIDATKVTLESASTGADGLTFEVKVLYDASHMFIFSLPAFVPAPPTTVSRSAAIQRGGY